MKHLKRFESNNSWKEELYSILEKKIAVGDELNKKLNKLSSEDDTLAKKMLSFFNSDEIKDDAKVSKVDYNKEDGKLLTVVDERGKERKFKFGKLLNYLGYNKNNVKPYEVENFLLNFTKSDTNNLREVSGKDILTSYNCNNYDNLEKVSGGSLQFSCMRFQKAQSYLEIYTSNPKQVSCLTLFNPENNKIQGRALVWNMDNGKRYMDRIYALSKEITSQFINYAEENNIERRASSTVTLERSGKYDYYPYMDTFQYYTPDTGVLSTSEGEMQLLSTTGGATEGGDTVWSEFYHEEISSGDAVYSQAMDSYIYSHDATEIVSDIDDNGNIISNDWIIDDESVHGLSRAVKLDYYSDKFSKLEGEHILTDLCVELEGGDSWVLEADKDIYDDGLDGVLVKVEALSRVDFDIYDGDNYCIQITYDGSRYYDGEGDYIKYTDACAFYNPIEERFDIIHEDDDWDDFMEEMYGDDSDIEYDRDKWDWNDYETINYMDDQKYTERVFVHSSLFKYDPEKSKIFSDNAPISVALEGEYIVKSDDNFTELHDNVYIESSKLETSCFKTKSGEYRLFPPMYSDHYIKTWGNVNDFIKNLGETKIKSANIKREISLVNAMRRGRLLENNLLNVIEDKKFYTFEKFRDAKFVSDRRMQKRPDYTTGFIKVLENYINENDSKFDFINQYKKKTENEDFMMNSSDVSFFGSYYMHKEDDNVNMIFPYIYTNDDKYVVYRTKNESFKMLSGSEIMQMFQKKLF